MPPSQNSTEAIYHRPNLYPKQTAAIFHNKRYGFIEAGTKTGKTYGCMAWIAEKCMLGQRGENRWWVAPVYRQAEMAYDRMLHSVPTDTYTSNDTDLRIDWANGTRLWFKSGEKSDNLYGEDVYDAVIDEASRMRETSYTAIRSTLTFTRGGIRGIGNVRGRKNWFYRLCRMAEGERDNPNRTMEFHRIIAYDAVEAGVLAKEEIEDAKKLLTEDAFKELYLAEPSDDGGNPFGYMAIQRCAKEGLSRLPTECFGVDLAKSTDWTVIIGLDCMGNVTFYMRFQKPWLDTVDIIRRECKDVPTFVDSTGVGDPILELLQKDGGQNFEGYLFTSKSKQQLMEGLSVAIQTGEIGYPDNTIKTELEQFEYEITRTGVKYSAPEGFHDDCVVALALAKRRQMMRLPGAGLIGYYEAQIKAREEEAARK